MSRNGQDEYAKHNILSSVLPALTNDKSSNYIIQPTFFWPSSEHDCSRHAIRLTHWLCSSCEPLFSRSNQSLENLPGKQDCQPIKHAPRHASLWALASLIWCRLQKNAAKFRERETQKLWEIKKSWPQDRKQQRLWLFLAWVRLKYHTLHFYRSCSGHILLMMLNVELMFKLKSWVLRVQSSLFFHFIASINHQL